MKRLIHGCGFIVKKKKSVAPTTQPVEFTGILVDPIATTLGITQKKLDKGLDQLKFLISKEGKSKGNSVQNEHIASTAGFLNFVSIVLMWARPFYRWMHDFSSGKSLHHYSNLPKCVGDDVRLLMSHLSEWNGKRKWSWSFSYIGYTDASLSGFGGILCDKDLKLVSSMAGVFSLRELKNIRSSGDMQHAEIFAALMYVVHFKERFKDRSVLLNIDNQADMYILKRWATKCPRLRSVLRCIAAVCATHNINLKVQHVRSEDNLFADWSSRPEKHEFRFGGQCGALLLSKQLIFHPSDPFTIQPIIT
jgi:hypothetical protein